MKKVLLTSVCRPLGVDGDAPTVGYELLFKQVTRAQGLFSPRTLNIHFSLEYIAENLDAPAVVLQYPSRAELIRELKKGYDYVGVTFLMAVFHKMRETVALIRRYSPRSKIVLGGYGTILSDDVLSPHADFICREEGVAFFRRLLGEPPVPMPYKHPLIMSGLKIFSVPVSYTGKIFAGLGCPNGCDFCCTSHFFKRRHIKLLPEGKDIFAVVERYLDADPNLVFLILDEDFLLNKKRALEFRDCVMKSGKTLSIFVFSSIKAISQYRVEEILEMGIDGFWIGYEGGTGSGYAKQRGRPIDEIFTEFREHGITILASMIVGFDYQDRAVVAEELKKLLSLKPTLAQFLIYGPAPGTPFYDRVIREGRLLDIYARCPEKFYRKADGFSTMMKHPTMAPSEIEDLQRWCFEEDFQKLGPSIYRVLETWWLGYRKLKDSANPFLCRKAGYFAGEMRKAYPIFLAGRLLGPNAEARRWIRLLEKRIYAALGPPTWKERLLSVLAVAAAVWTGVTLKLGLFQHPRLTRTSYRLPENNWRSFHLWEKIPANLSNPELSVHVELQHAARRVWMRLEGALSARHGEGLGQHLEDALSKSQGHLILDLQKLHGGESEGLRSLREKLVTYRSRIRLILPQLSHVHPELLLLTKIFHLYKG